jgi:histidine ammonia-lyase
MTGVLSASSDLTLAAVSHAAFGEEPVQWRGARLAIAPVAASPGQQHLRPLPGYVSRAIAFATLAHVDAGAHPAAPPLSERELRAPALGNVAAISAALGCVVAIVDRRRLGLVERVLALSIEAYRAPLDAYHPALAELWGDPHQTAALQRLDELLAGGDPARQRHQAPVSYRIVPRLTGQARRALAQLEEVATIALRGPARTPDATASPADLCHDAPTAAAIDGMSATWADLGALVHRHIVRLTRARGASDVPPVPAPTDAVDEMRRLAQPAVLGALEISPDANDDVPPLAPAAYLSHRRVTARLDEVLAVLAATCAGAPPLRELAVSPALSGVLDAVGRHAPPPRDGWSTSALASLADAVSDSIDTGRALGT